MGPGVLCLLNDVSHEPRTETVFRPAAVQVVSPFIDPGTAKKVRPVFPGIVDLEKLECSMNLSPQLHGVLFFRL